MTAFSRPDFKGHVQEVIDGLHVSPEHSALDLGCGDGSYLDALAGRSLRRVVGMDISLASLQVVAGRAGLVHNAAHSNVWLVCGTAARMPLADCSFDRVLCVLVLYLVPIEASLKELFRVTTVGGKVYIRVPMLSWARAFDILKRPSWRQSAYAAWHVANGVLFALTGYQSGLRLLRTDRWALHVSKRRLRLTTAKVGFLVERLRIARSVSGAPSIEAWLVKP